MNSVSSDTALFWPRVTPSDRSLPWEMRGDPISVLSSELRHNNHFVSGIARRLCWSQDIAHLRLLGSVNGIEDVCCSADVLEEHEKEGAENGSGYKAANQDA